MTRFYIYFKGVIVASVALYFFKRLLLFVSIAPLDGIQRAINNVRTAERREQTRANLSVTCVIWGSVDTDYLADGTRSQLLSPASRVFTRLLDFFGVDSNLIFFFFNSMFTVFIPQRSRIQENMNEIKGRCEPKNFSGFQCSFSGIFVTSDNRITDSLLQTITSSKKIIKARVSLEKKLQESQCCVK